MDEGKGESKKSRTPERKRSRSRSVDGSASGDSKRRKTADKQAKAGKYVRFGYIFIGLGKQKI